MRLRDSRKVNEYLSTVCRNPDRINTLKYSLSGNVLCIKRSCDVDPLRVHEQSKRSSITSFSEDSRRRMRRYLRSAESDYKVFLTLTYPCGYPTDGKTVKYHLKRFNQELFRNAYKRSGLSSIGEFKPYFSLFWFIEFQDRGAPHFHLFCTHGFKKEFISETWYRIVNSEDERHLKAGTRIEMFKRGRAGQISYCMKYASKMAQKVIPDEMENVGRFWGISGCRDVMAATTTFNASSIKSYAGLKRFENLYTSVLKYVKDREAWVMHEERDCIVIIFDRWSDAKWFRAKMEMTNALLNHRSTIFDDAELTDFDALCL